MLVIDASALVELLTAHPRRIPELSARLRAADWLCAPDLIDYEVLNVLRKMVLRGDVDLALADSARITICDLRLARYPTSDPISARIWRLRKGVSAYDASYVALAEHLGMTLVTVDARLARAALHLSPIAVECFAVAVE